MCERRQPESPTLLRSISGAGQWFPWQPSKGQPGQPGSKAHRRCKRGRTPSQPPTNTQNTGFLPFVQLTFLLARHDQEASSPGSPSQQSSLHVKNNASHKGLGDDDGSQSPSAPAPQAEQRLTQCSAQNRGRELGAGAGSWMEAAALGPRSLPPHIPQPAASLGCVKTSGTFLLSSLHTCMRASCPLFQEHTPGLFCAYPSV